MARAVYSSEELRSADPKLGNGMLSHLRANVDGHHDSEHIQAPASSVGAEGRRSIQGRKLGCSRGDNANGAELADPSSLHPAAMTDGWSNAEEAELQSHPACAEFVMSASTVSKQDSILVLEELPEATLAVTPARSRRQAQVGLRQCRLLHAGHSATANASVASRETGPGPSTESKEHPRNLKCGRASKLKVKSADDTGLFGRGNAGQLERFLEAIARADNRFVEKDIRHLQSRLWVVDCRLQQSDVKQLSVRNVQYQLALILQKSDRWDLRLQEVEQFDQDNGKLPRALSNQLEERTLGVWLQNLGGRHKQQTLSAERMQKLLNSPSSRVQARAKKWLEPEASFEEWIEELRQFVHVHRRMPSSTKANPRAEQQLIRGLTNHVNPANRNFKRRLQLLEKVGSVVADWVKSRRMRKVRVVEAPWSRQFDRLLGFVEVNERLPRKRDDQPLFSWLCRQRRQLSFLPSELKAKLLQSHPIIATFLQS